jgi:PAS domain S-box-containing protein
MGVAADSGRPIDDTRRRLEAVLNNATVSIILMDERQHCIYMNPAAELLTGYTVTQMVAMDKPLHDIIHHTHPDGTPFLLADCAIDRAFPERNREQGEEVFVHRDGSFYPVAFTASPVRDEAAETVGTIIEVRDIRLEKLAKERQWTLLNELNHRVKNTLATVQALAMHSFRGVRSEHLTDFSGRLVALSKAHDILGASSWKNASIAAVIEQAIEPFGKQRFEHNGPDCPIDPKASVSLALILHELGTNATKYGSLSNTKGKIHLSWLCQDDGDDLRVDMKWQEEGGPPVEPPTRIGFGTRLIKRQAAAEFGGSAAFEFNPEGLCCQIRVTVPKSPAPELD